MRTIIIAFVALAGLVGCAAEDQAPPTFYPTKEFIIACTDHSEALELDISLMVHFYGTGDLEATCSHGEADVHNELRRLPDDDLGIDTEGVCIADVDLGPVDAVEGFLQFEFNDGDPLATYLDSSGHPLNGTVHNFEMSACRAFVHTATGRWVEIDPADVEPDREVRQ